MSAAALFTDLLGRVLLVKPTYREQWLLPGGGAEPGAGVGERGPRGTRYGADAGSAAGRALAAPRASGH